MRPTPPIVLASASPRRRQLLGAAGLVIHVQPTDIDETPGTDEGPAALVLRLAREKAAACSAVDSIVVAADTTVALDDEILNKPVDDDDARRMLRKLSGRRHAAFTGWCVRDTRDGHVDIGVVETGVTFRALSADDIEGWIATGEHRDKAGAYGIQSSAVLVDRVDGSLTNVIGLPMSEVLAAIRARLSV